MSDADATVLENLRLARDYVLAKIVAGKDVVTYSIGDRSVTRVSATTELAKLEKLIEKYETRDERAASGGVSVANLSDRD